MEWIKKYFLISSSAGQLELEVLQALVYGLRLRPYCLQVRFYDIQALHNVIVLGRPAHRRLSHVLEIQVLPSGERRHPFVLLLLGEGLARIYGVPLRLPAGYGVLYVEEVVHFFLSFLL